LGQLVDVPVEPLIAALRNARVKSRWGVIDALAKIGERAVGPLIAVLKEADDEARVLAASTLGRIGDPRAVEPLIAALRYTRLKPRWPRKLVKFLDERPARLRRGAAGALGAIGDARAVEPLTAALDDTDLWVREYAKEALEKFRDPSVV
jgi:HEAT repeat protein